MSRRPGFAHSVIVAGVLALLAAILVSSFSSHWNVVTAIYLVTPILSLGYLLHFFHSTRVRTGRVVTIATWCLFALSAWWMSPSLPFYLLLHAGAVWFIRSLFTYASLVPALMDAALSAFAVMTFAWAFMKSGSVFLATWCFFLVQALWTRIPRRFPNKPGRNPDSKRKDPFERARRQADAALRQLFTQQD